MSTQHVCNWWIESCKLTYFRTSSVTYSFICSVSIFSENTNHSCCGLLCCDSELHFRGGALGSGVEFTVTHSILHRTKSDFSCVRVYYLLTQSARGQGKHILIREQIWVQHQDTFSQVDFPPFRLVLLYFLTFTLIIQGASTALPSVSLLPRGSQRKE